MKTSPSAIKAKIPAEAQRRGSFPPAQPLLVYGRPVCFAWQAANRDHAAAMQVTLNIHPDTLARFEDAHANLAAWLGYVPSLEWLMAFALDCSDPGDLDETLRQMARDYLRNRRLFD